MRLQDLNKELYRSKSEIEKRKHKESKFDVNAARKSSADIFVSGREWKKPEKGLSASQKKIIGLGILIVAIIAGIATTAVIYYRFKKTAFSEDKVSLEIIGPEKVDSSQLITYKIKYKNDNRVDLRNAEILLNYQENLQPEGNNDWQILNSSNSKIGIAKIKSHGEGEAEFKARIYAPEDYQVFLKLSLIYTPANFNSQFKQEKQLSVIVKSSPIQLDVIAPLEAASGNYIEYLIDYKNTSLRNFNDLRLKVEYPEGFTYQSAEPSPSEGNNFWYIGNLNENQFGKIKIFGNVEGPKDYSKILKVYVGSMDDSGKFLVYSERTKSTKIVSSPLSIYQRVNNLINPNINEGEGLNYEVNFSNNGDQGIRNAIVTVEISSPYLDFPDIRVSGGYYDGSKGIITWKAVDVPQLANLQPGQGGNVKFSISVKRNIKIGSYQDKNFSIVSVAKIDSPDIPTPFGANKIISSNRTEVKINSAVVFESKYLYDDPNMTNSGPNPPVLGQETTYTIHYLITNTYNEISDVKITSSLPTGARWTGKIFPETENISFNERTNSLSWDAGNLKNAVGILEPKKEVSFQVAVTPQINQIGAKIILSNAAVLKAKDKFTNQDIGAKSSEVIIFASEEKDAAE